MLFRLASLLRRSLDEQAHEVALRQELSFLNDYIDIMRVRFGERLDIRLAVAPDALDARVPVFLLQPLMENAIEHGERDDGRTVIALWARRRDDTLRVVVENSGPSLTAGAAIREGVGLGNTRARLREMYGDRASVDLGPARDAATAPGARVELALPYAPMAAAE
jgi:LytS/YehU family sensor histidine kinase